MRPRPHRAAAGFDRTSAVLVLSLLATLVTGLAALPHAAAARTVDVVLTDREPAAVSLAPGDSVRFVNGEQGPLAPPHRVVSTSRDGSTAWTYESDLLTGGGSTAPVRFDAPGTYLYLDRRGVGPLATEALGRIVVTAPPPADPPAEQPATAAPAPATGGGGGAAPGPAPRKAAPPTGPSTAPSAGLPGPAGGDGRAALPPIAGGPAPAPRDGAFAGGPPGEVVLPPAVSDGSAADALAAEQPPVQALTGPLPGSATPRGLGLPATLAALAALGVASLLVRVLLAEPAAARRRPLLPVTAG